MMLRACLQVARASVTSARVLPHRMICHCFAAQQPTACWRDDRRIDAASSVLF
jgi:hypothetical protein